MANRAHGAVPFPRSAARPRDSPSADPRHTGEWLRGDLGRALSTPAVVVYYKGTPTSGVLKWFFVPMRMRSRTVARRVLHCAEGAVLVAVGKGWVQGDGQRPRVAEPLRSCELPARGHGIFQ